MKRVPNPIRIAGLTCLALALTACASRPPSREKLRAMGAVAVVARVEKQGPTASLGEDERARILLGVSNLSATEVNARLEKALGKIEGLYETETRFRGEFLDRLGDPPPFEVASPGVMMLTGELLARSEGPPSYKPLAAQGITGVLELSVDRLEVVPASGSRPSGLAVEVNARFLELPGESVSWKASAEVLPEEGSALAIDPAALKADPQRAYLEALSAAAKAVGEKLARDFGAEPMAAKREAPAPAPAPDPE